MGGDGLPFLPRRLSIREKIRIEPKIKYVGNADGAASCRFATRPDHRSSRRCPRTRPGHPPNFMGADNCAAHSMASLRQAEAVEVAVRADVEPAVGDRRAGVGVFAKISR